MIFEYTPDEWEQLVTVDGRYSALLDVLDQEIAATPPASPALAKLRERRVALEDERIEEFAALYDQFEQAHFDALGSSTAAILADAKRLVPMIIERLCTERQKYDLVFDQATTLFDKDAGPRGPMKPRQDAAQDAPKLESGEALATLRSELRRHFAALAGHDEEAAELRDYIYSYISTSTYTYTDPTRPLDLDALGPDFQVRLSLQTLQNIGLMNDKVSHQLIAQPGHRHEVNGQTRLLWGIEQSPRGPSVPVYASLMYDGPGVQLSKPMTAFDYAIYNSVSTLWHAYREKYPNRPVFLTLQQLWRVTNGLAGNKWSPSPTQLQRVRDSLDKMRFTRIYLNISEEIKAGRITWNDSRLVKGSIDTYLLKADLVSFTTDKGRTLEGYRIEQEPVLYTYNVLKDHFIWMDYALLNTSSATGNDGYTVEFRQYLMLQIHLMKKGYRDSSNILYETLYKSAAIKPPETRIDRTRYASEASYNSKVRQEAKKDREKIAAILGVWCKAGFIRDFTPIMKGKKHIGIHIDLVETDT